VRRGADEASAWSGIPLIKKWPQVVRMGPEYPQQQQQQQLYLLELERRYIVYTVALIIDRS
jgi:hypothetical protein